MASFKITKITPLSGEGPRLQIEFERSSADPELREPSYQQELHRIEAQLRHEDQSLQPQVGLQKTADGSFWFTGNFAVLVQAVGPTFGVVLVAWLQGRAGRKVKLKIGDMEAEAGTPKQVEQLLALAFAYKDELAKAQKE